MNLYAPRHAKYGKRCCNCREMKPARYRAALDDFACQDCYQIWSVTGEMPAIQFAEEGDQAAPTTPPVPVARVATTPATMTRAKAHPVTVSRLEDLLAKLGAE